MKNNYLINDLDNILFTQDSIETDITKLAVSKAYDSNLDYPYIIDVEDTGYFYANSYERDNDYEELIRKLTDNSSRYFYF